MINLGSNRKASARAELCCADRWISLQLAQLLQEHSGSKRDTAQERLQTSFEARYLLETQGRGLCVWGMKSRSAIWGRKEVFLFLNPDFLSKNKQNAEFSVTVASDM